MWNDWVEHPLTKGLFDKVLVNIQDELKDSIADIDYAAQVAVQPGLVSDYIGKVGVIHWIERLRALDYEEYLELFEDEDNRPSWTEIIDRGQESRGKD